HLERRVRALARPEAEARAGHPCIGAFVGDLLARPQALHHRERLLELGHAVLAPEPGRLQLALAVADRDAQLQTPMRDLVEGDDARRALAAPGGPLRGSPA